MQVGILGPFQIYGAGNQLIEIGGGRVRMLLARLALDTGQWVSAETLIDDLWGGNPPSGALNALQSLVSRARRALPAGSLRSGPAGYALDADRVDAREFERLAAHGRRLLRDGELEAAAATLREALTLWRGTPFAGFADAHFATAAHTRLEEIRLTALEDRLDADLRLGRHAEPVPELDAEAARYPLRERLAALRIRALYASGRQADALAAYEDLRHRLADEFGIDPSTELRELHLAVLRDDPKLTAAPPRQTKPVAAVPRRLSSFVGRESEIQQVSKALSRSRLVTLFGPGGAGKTRLATESATGSEFGRVLFVELAPVRDGSDLASAVLSALGFRETRMPDSQAPAAATTRLVDWLVTEPTLLVLDNCEHLIAEVAELTDALLLKCPELGVLTTSREPLALTGEELLPVGPLELPQPDRPVSEAAAVRLFVDRAAAVSPGFALDERTSPDVVEVCRRLDGMPLAIELAAARLRSMSIQQIAARLDDRFRLLTNGNRTSMPRHRTLRAVVEWSWELLDDAERVLARRMSVFAGSADADAIASVCSGPDLPAGDVFYVLSSLVEKSFVDAVAGDRYRMLETVRAYCEQRLNEAGEDTRGHHAEYFADVAETIAPRIHLGDQLVWMERLDAEHDNIMAALYWAVRERHASIGVRLGAALAWYWSVTTPYLDVVSRLDAISEIPGEGPADSAAVVGLMRSFTWVSEDWFSNVRQAAGPVRDSAAMERYPFIAMMEPFAWMIAGDEDEMERAIERAAAHPNPWARAAALHCRAHITEHCGDVVASEEQMRAAAQAFRDIGDRWGIAQTTKWAASSRSLRGDHAGAITALQESEKALREFGCAEEVAPLLTQIAAERLRAKDFTAARADLDEALRAAMQHPHQQVLVYGGLSEWARLAGDFETAQEYLELLRKAEREVARTPPPMRQLVLVYEAKLCVSEHRFEQARGLLAEAIDSGMAFADMPLTAMLAEQVAKMAAASGNPDSGARALGIAVALRGILDEGDPEVRDVVTALRVTLGPETYDRTFSESAALQHDQARAALRALVS